MTTDHPTQNPARFVDFHRVGEAQAAIAGPVRFALVIALADEGVVLVFNRYRRVWELPGGLIDPGVQNEEIADVAYWRRDACPQPLGQTDSALLARFG